MIKYVLFCLLFTNAFAETLYCTHAEVCRLAKNQLDSKIELKELVTIAGDPHEFEPSSDEIKALISAPILLSGPNELNPWMKKILYQRSKNSKLLTFSLSIPQKIATKYNNNREALSHFWLYPDLYCDLGVQLSNWEFTKKNSNSKKFMCDHSALMSSLKSKIASTEATIILTHDALQPILNELAHSKIKIISLRGSGHHEEVSSASIKEMYLALKDKKRIWIIEKNINIPENITNKIGKNDKKILVDTSKLNTNSNEDFSTLKTIIEEISK